MKAVIINFFSIQMYLKFNAIKKIFFKYRHLDFSVFLELLNRTKKGKVAFIQIGASDGITNDPINFFVKKYDWTGTLVEPLPYVFEQLKENYRSCNNLQFLNLAVSESNEPLDLYYLPKEFVQDEWQKQLASFDKRAIEFNLRDYPVLLPKIATLKVPTADLKSLFEKTGQPTTDLFILDVEGYEYNILKQLTNISHWPDYIFFEKGTMAPEKLKQLQFFLTEAKYRIYTCGPDDLAVKTFK